METSSRTKYEWLRQIDATTDLVGGVLGTGATSPDQLDLPALLSQVPEYHASLVPQLWPDVLVSVMKPKNSGAVATCAHAIKMYMNDLFQRMDEGKPVVYHYFLMTPEIFLGMDMAPICFEIYPALLCAFYQKGVEEEIDHIEEKGYPGHLCSAQKGATGAFEMGRMPLPTVMVKHGTPCDPSNMLYQYTMEKFNVPMIVVDSPYYSNQRAFRYYLDEWKRMIDELEKLTGHTIDEDRLRKHVEWGNKQVEYLYGLQMMRRAIPNPDPGMHRVLDTAALFLCGTTQEMADYMKTCHDEAKARYDQGKGFLPEGRNEIRTLWSWAWTGHFLSMYDWLEEEFGMSYLECGLSMLPGEVVGFVNTSTVDSMIEGLAWRSFNMPMARQVFSFSDIWISDFVNVAKSYHADAAVFSGHMACKHAWALNKLLSDSLREEAGIPSFRWEVDIIDARFTPHESAKNMLTEFFSTLR
jgi:benzoyl-CoA reductase/2-hydroxyglutaryl-CoA dehydratase subunit BcrC/BadD/HgdB